MPIYNEAGHIERCLSAVLSQDYPPHLIEVLIADSQSTDGTIDCIEKLILRNPGRRIRILDNRARTPGAGLNLMIRHATGEIVVRVDGHTEIAPDYVRWCVTALQTSDAVNVGGCITASGEAFLERAIAIAISSFWGNGGARFRSYPVKDPVFVDTVPFGAWRRETFARLGLFIEQRAGEDCDFNLRTLDAGGKILLHPRIRATYFPRKSLSALAMQYFRYGKLKWRVIASHPKQLRARQLAPPILVLILIAFVWLWLFGKASSPLLLIVPCGYLITIVLASLLLAFRDGQLRYALVLPAVLPTLHFSYGIGALMAVPELLPRLLRATHRSRALAPELVRASSESSSESSSDDRGRLPRSGS